MEEDKNKNTFVEMDIADAIIDKPYAFSVAGKAFKIYPPSLGKSFIIERLVKALEVNVTTLRSNIYLESMRVCHEKKDIVCRLLAYGTFSRKNDILDKAVISKRAEFFESKLSEEELTQLLILSLSFDNTDEFIKHLEIEKDKAFRDKVSKAKKSDNTYIFGGKSIYGTLIDVACERYGWTFDYVVWGISYVNLRMLVADMITSVYLSDEERKKARLPKADEERINMDDPKNWERIKQMDFD
jgi:hypothetical protein